MKIEKLPSLLEVEKHETNPFVVELQGKMFLQPRANTIIAKSQALVDTNTGEIIDEAILIGKRKIVDKSQFAKIYASEISILYELSKTAQNIFLYLIKVMDYDNRVYFNYKREFAKVNYTAHTAPLKGLRELIAKNIIACDIREHTYWLNPTIVCKGERFAKYVEYVVGTEEEVQKQELLHKKQQKEHIEKLPNQVYNKYNIASSQSTQADLQIQQQQKEKSFLQQGNLFKETPDLINPITGEIMK
ncbi:MAG: hypothetical protein Q4A58_07955 [Fusobacterium sp.]|uniref:hypothetical protein n=1 Tax=Fusobacterium sp. TaxID=68766 RepID=UPI0026DD028A|nr:hypothetical protein [Fusobacterium sp.]MDO4691210.1 hypothetical protein [Fusobacterium sp.]